MKTEAVEILAKALEADIATQAQGDSLVIGEKWDEVYAQLLPIEDDIDNPIYKVAFQFWDDWGDASNHDWRYHEPTTKEQWPLYAKAIAESLRSGKLSEETAIINQFSPKPKVNLIQRIKQWLG